VEDDKNGNGGSAASDAEGEAAGAAERLLELARRGKRRVAWRA
jgi:hypothetical protein